jgi:outer membrane protein assembly factor BamD
MFQKMHRNILILVLFLFFFSSCGEYEKLLKSGDVDAKYKMGLKYYDEGNWTRASTLFEQIIPRLKGTDKAEEIDYKFAMCYYNMKDYVLAGHYFRTFVATYYSSSHAEEADFLSAYCYYKLSPRPELDQSNTLNAINAFTLFKNKFPNSSKIEEADKMTQEMINKLVEKSFINARLYYNLGKYKAAIVAIKNSISDYPDSKYREELIYLKLRSSFLLAEGSIRQKQEERYQNTVDEYYSFVDEFPDSKYKRDAEKIYNEATGYLTKNQDKSKKDKS